MPHLSPVRPALSWRELLTVAREDYTVAVLLLGTLIAAVWLMPFAIYRALQGNWWAMSNDVALSVLFVWAGHRAWRTGDTRLSGWVVACATVGGIWAIGWVARFAALFWVYPGVLMLFSSCPHGPLLCWRLWPSVDRLTCRMPTWVAVKACRFSCLRHC